jgi:hypothetical protein
MRARPGGNLFAPTASNNQKDGNDVRHRGRSSARNLAVSPIPRLVRWGIALITAFFVVMMFSPLVQEIVRRVRLSGTVNLP